ncbi:MAG: PocR ligand-binding domain-containing protein [Desulfobacterales bacterium]|jgi:ligand-binding sensor protein
MQLTDLQPLEKWVELEEAIHRRSGMRASIYDVDGVGITGRSQHANDLCPAIRDTGKGQTYICAVAHQNMAAMARKGNAPVIEECDAGLIKIVVPIFAGDEFIGAAGGCGLLLEDGEVDDFMINKTTDLAEEKIAALAGSVATITPHEAEKLAAFIAGEIERVVKGYQG